MLLNKTRQILKDLIGDKRAMSPAPSMGGAKGGTMDPRKTDAGNRIEQHEQAIKELEPQLQQELDKLNTAEQGINQAESQLDIAKQSNADTTGQEQEVSKLKQVKGLIEKEIAGINEEIETHKSRVSSLKGDVGTEKKANVLSMIPQTKIAGEAIKQAERKKHDAQDTSSAGKIQGAEAKVQGAQAKEGQAKVAAAQTAAAQAPAGAAPAGGASAGAGIGRGLSGITSQALGGTGRGAKKIATLIPFVGVALAAIVGVFAVKSGGTSALNVIAPFIIFIVGVVMVVASKLRSIPGWVMIGGVAGWAVYKSSGNVNWMAMLPFGLFILGLIILEKSKDESGHRSTLAVMLVAVIFVGAGLLFIAKTAPYAQVSLQKGTAQESAKEAVSTGKKGISSLISDTIKSYKTSVAEASGQRVEGDVDKSVKEDVGIEILPYYLPNLNKLNFNEVSSLETSARIKGFDPKTPIHVAVSCHLQSTAQEKTISQSVAEASKGGPKKDLGKAQSLRPKEITGSSFDREITCYPRPESCGDYKVAISAQADKLRTDATMINYIIDKTMLEKSLKAYAQRKNTELKSQSQINSAIKEEFPILKTYNYKSKSEKGAIKVLMATRKASLIGVDKDTELKFVAGVENVKKGWIMGINSVTVTIPEFFQPLSGFCDSWALTGYTLKLKDSYIKTADFSKLSQRGQKIFPSCLLVPSGSYDLKKPREAFFRIAVDYNYIAQEFYSIKVLTSNGTVCKKPAASLVASSTGGSNGTTTTKTAPTQQSATTTTA